MVIESEKFVLTSIDLLYIESREISINPDLKKSGIRQATVFCKNCENLWRSSAYGDGKFQATTGHFIFTCPKCAESENIKSSTLMI